MNDDEMLGYPCGQPGGTLDSERHTNNDLNALMTFIAL